MRAIIAVNSRIPTRTTGEISKAQARRITTGMTPLTQKIARKSKRDLRRNRNLQKQAMKIGTERPSKPSSTTEPLS
jgi:hypothetical protein